MIGLELVELNCTEGEKGILLQYDLALLDLSGSEKSPPLARRLPNDEGRTAWFVGFPVLDLAILGAVGNFLTDTAFQLLLGRNFTEATRGHAYLS